MKRHSLLLFILFTILTACSKSDGGGGQSRLKLSSETLILNAVEINPIVVTIDSEPKGWGVQYTNPSANTWLNYRIEDNNLIISVAMNNTFSSREEVLKITNNDIATQLKISQKPMSNEIANIPDPVFRAYCLKALNKKEGDVIYAEELVGFGLKTIIYLPEAGVKSLDGMQYFKHLEYLTCQMNMIKNIDASKNIKTVYISAYKNEIENINISGLTKLRELICDNNKLTTLDVSSNSSLEFIYCSENNINSLDLSSNSRLTHLWCRDNNIASMNVKNCNNLNDLACSNNKLTSLDISSNSLLNRLGCSYNNISELNLSTNIELTSLSCDNNNLNSMKLGDNKKLASISCNKNKLSSLDISKLIGLESLNCDSNPITALDLTNNQELTFLSCSNSPLTELDISKNTKLTTLYCHNSDIKTIYVWLGFNPAQFNNLLIPEGAKFVVK